jgi:hypothetical protein
MGGIEERGAIAVSEFLAQKQGQAKANTGVLHFVQDDDVKRGHSKADFALICVASEAKGKNKQRQRRNAEILRCAQNDGRKTNDKGKGLAG